MSRLWLLGLGIPAGLHCATAAILPATLAQCQDGAPPIACEGCQHHEACVDAMFDLLQVAQSVHARAPGAAPPGPGPVVRQNGTVARGSAGETLDAQFREHMASQQNLRRTEEQSLEYAQGCTLVECPLISARALAGNWLEALRAVQKAAWPCPKRERCVEAEHALLVAAAAVLLLLGALSVRRWLDPLFEETRASSRRSAVGAEAGASGREGAETVDPPCDAEKLRSILAEIFKVCHENDDCKPGKTRPSLPIAHPGELIHGAEFESMDIGRDGALQGITLQFQINSLREMDQIDTRFEAKLGDIGLGAKDLDDYILEMTVTDSSGKSYRYNELVSAMPNGPSEDMFPAFFAVNMSKDAERCRPQLAQPDEQYAVEDAAAPVGDTSGGVEAARQRFLKAYGLEEEDLTRLRQRAAALRAAHGEEPPSEAVFGLDETDTDTDTDDEFEVSNGQ